MIHRSRRHLATLPARRGMRASWLRRRIPDEVDVAQSAPPTAEPAEPADAVEPEPASPTTPPVARAAFGHPTF